MQIVNIVCFYRKYHVDDHLRVQNTTLPPVTHIHSSIQCLIKTIVVNMDCEPIHNRLNNCDYKSICIGNVMRLGTMSLLLRGKHMTRV